MALSTCRIRIISRFLNPLKSYRNFASGCDDGRCQVRCCTPVPLIIFFILTKVFSLKKGIVLGLYEAESTCDPLRFTSRGEIFNNRLEGKLMEVAQETGLNGKIGQARVFNGIDKEFGSVCVVGLGKEGIGFCEIEALDEGMVTGSLFGVASLNKVNIRSTFLHRKTLELPQV